MKNDEALLYRARIRSLTDDELFNELLDRHDDDDDECEACCQAEVERRAESGFSPDLKKFCELVGTAPASYSISVMVPDDIVYAVIRHQRQT